MGRVRTAVTFALLASTLFVWTPAGADEPRAPVTSAAREEAAQRYQRGRELYVEENFAAALVEFRKSYGLTGEYRVLYNIGQVCFQAHDYVCAEDALKRYLAEGGREVPEARRHEVTADLEKLRARIGSAEVLTSEPGVAIAIDDVPRGTTPLAPVRLSAGVHQILATKVGKLPVTRAIELAGGEAQRIELKLLDQAPQVVVRERADAPAEKKRWTALSFAGLAAGGALATGAVVSGVLALDAANDLKNTRFYGDRSGDLDAQEGRVKTLRTVSDVCTGLAIVTVGATLYFTLTRRMDEPAPAKVSSARDVRAGVRGLGVVVEGEF